MRASLYARVSSEEQVEGYSIDAQRRAFQTLLQTRGWTEYREYIDEGKSARNDNINQRPAFKEMVSHALAGKFDVLIVHKLDRFSRNLRITLEYFEKLLKAGVTFISINEQMDFTTPSGKVHLALLGAFAQYYSDNLSQETKKGWHERRAQGLYCGLLPFGAMKGDDGVPIPHHDTHPGLVMAFNLAAKGKSDREVAMALNAAGYRTAGNQRKGLFSKDTVRNMLQNRFYLGELPDGNNGWVKGKHRPLINVPLFDVVQELRSRQRRTRNTIPYQARTYSLSYVSWCNRCGGKIRMQMSPKGRARVYCASRSQGFGCDFNGTFLDVYEDQIEWYLKNFVIPEDYQIRILEDHRKLEESRLNIEERRAKLKAILAQLKKQHRWGHISDKEYLTEYKDIKHQLEQLTPMDGNGEMLKRLAHFLKNVADAWRESRGEQRNRLARTLFEEVRLDNNGKVVAIKPKPELEPFFKLSYDCHTKDIGCDPGGI